VAFVSGACAVIASTVLWHRILKYARPSNHYGVMFRGSVSGLDPGSDVERNGVVVGVVTDVSLTKEVPPRVIVDAAVNSGVPVMRDSVVSLDESSAGRFVQITGGTAAAGRLKNGDEISASEESVANVLEPPSQSSHEISELTSTTNRELKEHRRLSLATTIENLSDAGRSLKKIAAQASAAERWHSIDSTLDNLNRASQSLGHTMEEVNKVVGSFAAHRDQIYGRIDDALARLNRTLDDSHQLLMTSNTLMKSTEHVVSSTSSVMDRDATDIERTLAEMDRSARAMSEFIQTMESNPSPLFFGHRSEDREPE
jgi:phospholipid/cholesterol/gamma-HCH transport system substrate-binding protein